MGASQSNVIVDNPADRLLFRTLNKIGSDLIINTNYEDLFNFTDMNYCNNMVGLTKDALNANYTKNQIILLNKLINKKNTTNSDTNASYKKESYTKESFFTGGRGSIFKKNIIREISQNTSRAQAEQAQAQHAQSEQSQAQHAQPEQAQAEQAQAEQAQAIVLPDVISKGLPDYKNYKTKKVLCLEISIFYVKIAHAYASIVKVINPQMKKGKFKGFSGFCARKINKFDYKETPMENNESKKISTISSTYCEKDLDENDKHIQFLNQEMGFPSLEALYKDKYDDETNTWVMSNTADKYKEDVATFVKFYTGEENTKIDSFGKIPIYKYKSKQLCEKMEERATGVLSGMSDNNNMSNFANHLALIMNNSHSYDKELITILNELFKPSESESGNDFVINHNLTIERLDAIISKARDAILSLYLQCDKDYKKGVILFKKIILDKNITLIEEKLKVY